MDEQWPTAKDAVRIGKEIADLIQKSGENPEDGVRIVVREIFRELSRSGYSAHQLTIAVSCITDCILEATKRELKEKREREEKELKQELSRRK